MLYEHIHMKPIPFPGYPAPFWFRNIGLLEDIIKELNLRAIPEKYMPKGVPEMNMKAVSSSFAFDPGTHGGNRGPHLHLGENIYILNEEQWKVFSNRIGAEFHSKLERANTIPVQDVMALDDVISGISVRSKDSAKKM
jgi:hypothetical protein